MNGCQMHSYYHNAMQKISGSIMPLNETSEINTVIFFSCRKTFRRRSYSSETEFVFNLKLSLYSSATVP